MSSRWLRKDFCFTFHPFCYSIFVHFVLFRIPSCRCRRRRHCRPFLAVLCAPWVSGVCRGTSLSSGCFCTCSVSFQSDHQPAWSSSKSTSKVAVFIEFPCQGLDFPVWLKSNVTKMSVCPNPTLVENLGVWFKND